MVELLKEAIHEITAEPVVFAVEVVQFALLLGVIIWALPRFIGKGLVERRDKIAADLEEAAKTEKEYAGLKKEAQEIVVRAEAEAKAIIKTAKETAKKERKEASAQADAEVKEIILRAQQTVEADKDRVIAEASEQLISLITETTRRYLDEALTETERRELTQKIILESLEEMESVSAVQATE